MDLQSVGGEGMNEGTVDVDEFVSGECSQEIPWGDDWWPVRDLPENAIGLRGVYYHRHSWRWLNIGGGGPVMPAEAGTALHVPIPQLGANEESIT